MIDKGFNLVTVGSDQADILTAGAKSVLEKIKKGIKGSKSKGY